MSITTPTTWPEMARPTPEQFVRWYEACTAAERLEVMTRLLADSEAASTCFTMNHKALPYIKDQRDRLTEVLVEETDRRRAAETEVARLRKLLSDHAEDARDDVAHWGGYAGDYFAEKWGLTDDIAKWERRRDLNQPGTIGTPSS